MNKYSRKLLKYLEQYYTSEQLDRFEWFVDFDSDFAYSLNFVDHAGSHRKATFYKSNGKLELKEVE
jgi:hypothetical protein